MLLRVLFVSAVLVAFTAAATATTATTATTTATTTAALSLRERARRTGIIPSVSSLVNSAKEKAQNEINKILPGLQTFRDKVTSPITNTINSLKDTAKNTLNQAGTDTKNWVSTAVNNELTPMLTAVDSAKSGLVNEINKVKTMANNLKNGLNDLVQQLKTFTADAFKLDVNPNCPLPTAITQINKLAKDYAGVNELIPQEKWCTVIAMMEKIGAGGSKSVAGVGPISAQAATSFLEKVSRLGKLSIHSSSFMEAAAGIKTGMHVQVADLTYSCPKMLQVSDVLDGSVVAAHLMVSAIDTNLSIAGKLQFGIGGLGIVARAGSAIMRGICAFYKRITCSP